MIHSEKSLIKILAATKWSFGQAARYCHASVRWHLVPLLINYLVKILFILSKRRTFWGPSTRPSRNSSLAQDDHGAARAEGWSNTILLLRNSTSLFWWSLNHTAVLWNRKRVSALTVWIVRADKRFGWSHSARMNTGSRQDWKNKMACRKVLALMIPE